MKIARGKVKDDEKYTCPICDWRVKIPRDAARPKLEDLQQWQDEIAGLPFQPDEEDILDNIINNAQEFRNHVAPFCNPIMATSEEAATQRFYLRKIEGAEILLAYETNFFRQELHKWSPVAPEAPPVLDSSKSTRKPRPTKLQKLMAQHGVDNPDSLPQALRTKQHSFKRKSSEPTNARPQPLQPAPGRSDSGTPTSHTFPNHISGSGGPQSMHHGPVLSGVPRGPDHHHPSFSYDENPYAPSMQAYGGASISAPYSTDSPRVSTIDPALGPGIFTGAALARPDVALGVTATLDSPMRDTFAPSMASSQNRPENIDKMFNDLTNQDEDSQNTMRGATQGLGRENDRPSSIGLAGSRMKEEIDEPMGIGSGVFGMYGEPRFDDSD